MNKLLLGSAAIAGLVLASAPAQAQMELTIGGHSKNYVGYLDQDDAAAASTRAFDMQRETELHFNGESTLDSGLTFGFQVEAEVDAGDDGATAAPTSDVIEESYIYMSGAFGRVNLGSEDGAAYLLQVAAPSADANIDGLRQTIQPVNYANIGGAGIAAAYTNSNAAGTPGSKNTADGFDYDQDITGVSEKITYLSPNFSGFQFGASYSHDLGDGGSANNTGVGFNADNTAGTYGEAYDLGLRYEGVFSNFGYAIGAGYTHADLEASAAVPAAFVANDDYQAYNVGIDVDTGPFGIGAAYLSEDRSVADGAGGSNGEDVDTYVVGVDYTTGPFKFGASYFTQDDETAAAAGTELETDRYTGGVVYTAGPGLSFRGSVSYIDHDLAAAEADATSVMGGVQINF